MKHQLLRRIFSLCMGMALLAGYLFCIVTNVEATVLTDKSDVVIMSFNLLTTGTQPISAEDPVTGDTRGEKLINLINEKKPDSMGLNEVSAAWLTYLNSNVTTSDYGEAEYSLTGLNSSSGLSLVSDVGEYSPIIYRSDRYDVVETGGCWYSETPDVASKYDDILDSDGNIKYAGMKFNRVLTYAVFATKTGEIAYIHVNTHFDHKSSDYVNLICARQLTQKAEELAEEYGGCPVVITGDFNATEETMTWAYLQNGENGFVDAKYLTDSRSLITTSAGYGADYNANTTVVIDHVFVSKGNIGAYQHDVIVDPYASDHSCVYAKLALNDLPKIDAISFDGVQNDDFSAYKYSCQLAVDEQTTMFQMKIDPSYNVYFNGILETSISGADFNYQKQLSLLDGSNLYTVCLENADGVRTEYTFDIYKNYGNINLVISEINPSSSNGYQYFEVTNLGTRTANLTDYVFLWGSIATDGNVDWEYKYNMADQNEKKTIKAGETAVFLVASSGSVDDFNENYQVNILKQQAIEADMSAPWINGAADTITMTGNRSRGMRIAYAKDEFGTEYTWENTDLGQVFTGDSVAISSYYNRSESDLVNGQFFKFSDIEDSVIDCASNVFENEDATPGKYDRYIGTNYRNAFLPMEAEELEENYILSIDAIGIANTRADSWAFYSNVDFGVNGSAEALFYGAVRTANASGLIEIYIDGTRDGDLSNATLIGTCETTGIADNWTTFDTFSCHLNERVTGVHNVTLKFIPSKTFVINLDYFQFVEYVGGPDVTGIDSVEFQIDSTAITDSGITVVADMNNRDHVLSMGIDYDPSDAELDVRYVSSDSTIASIDADSGEFSCLKSGDVTFTAIVYSNMLEYERFESPTVTIKYTKNAFDFIESEWAEDFTEGLTIGGDPATAGRKYTTSASGMSTYVTEDQKNFLGNTVNGSTVSYYDVNFGSGALGGVIFNMAIKTGNCGGTIEIYVDGTDGALGTLIGTCEVANEDATDSGAGNYNTYSEFWGTIINPDITGIHNVLLKFVTDEGMSYVGNIDYFCFVHSEEAVAYVEACINAIGAVTLDSEASIILARETYEKLPDRFKAEVDNYSILAAAENTLWELQNPPTGAFSIIEAEWAEHFTEGTTIGGDPATAGRKYTSSASGMSSYVTEDGKNFLGNTVSNSTVSYIRIDFGNEPIAGVEFNMAIKTGNCGGTVEIRLRNADGTPGELIGYCTVSNDQANDNGEGNYNTYSIFKGVVTNTSISGINDLMLRFVTDEGMSYIGNIDYFCFVSAAEAITNVETFINVIGEVTLESEEAIGAAREAYNSLMDQYKSQVENYEVLVAAEEALEELKNPSTDAFGVIEAENAVNFTEGLSIGGDPVTAARKYASGATGMSEYVTTDGKNYLGHTVDGSTVTYERINFGGGEISGIVFNMAIKTGNCGGRVEVYLKNEDGTIGSLIAYCAISNSQATDSGAGNYNTYMEFTGVIVNGNVSGIHDIILKFVTDEGMSYIGNIDYFTFVASSVE